MPSRNTDAVLLAAGNSRRLGRPKQLLPYGGKTLIEYTIDVLLQTNVRRLVIVTGAYSDAICQVIGRLCEPRLTTIEHQGWEQGQGSSLMLGLSAVGDDDANANVLVTLCDQPLITSKHYQTLCDAIDENVAIAATTYASGGGVPACFGYQVIGDLASVLRITSAKQYIRKQPSSRVRLIESEDSLHDIDTQTDYENVQGIGRKSPTQSDSR